VLVIKNFSIFLISIARAACQAKHSPNNKSSPAKTAGSHFVAYSLICKQRLPRRATGLALALAAPSANIKITQGNDKSAMTILLLFLPLILTRNILCVPEHE
jgi:hypothetical protein